MHLDWKTLAEISVVAAAATLTVVVLVALALVASSGRPASGTAGGSATDGRPAGGTAVAVFCLVAAGLVAVCGLYVIIA